MYKLLTMLLLTAVIAGCAGSPARLSLMSPEGLRQASSGALCNAYHHNGTDSLKEELLRRNDLTDDEWTLVEGGAISRGMSELALVCAWGFARDVNKTVGNWGVHKQWVYRDCESCRARYVYTENGLITSWQN